MDALQLPGMPEPAPTPEPLSADRRRTIANQRLLDAGIHPATHRPLLPWPPDEPEFDVDRPTCAMCIHFRRYSGGHARAYNKCAKHRLGESHSAASDIRISWPACALFEGNGDS